MVLAGNGRTIDGGGAADETEGIQLSSSSNTQIQNAIVTGWGTGIAADSFTGGSKNAVTAVDNTIGIEVASGRNVIINSPIVQSNARWGIAFSQGTTESSVRGGNVFDNGQALYISGAVVIVVVLGYRQVDDWLQFS